MSDKDDLLALLARFGVEFTADYHQDQRDRLLIVMCSANDKMIAGYDGFFVEFCFHADGEFARMGVWE